MDERKRHTIDRGILTVMIASELSRVMTGTFLCVYISQHAQQTKTSRVSEIPCHCLKCSETSASDPFTKIEALLFRVLYQAGTPIYCYDPPPRKHQLKLKGL